MRVTSQAAQFGRGVMQDVSAKLMTRFADCLAQQMQASPGRRDDDRGGARTRRGRGRGPGRGPRGRDRDRRSHRRLGRRLDHGAEDTGVPGASCGVSSAEAESTIPSASSGTSSATAARPTDDVLDLGEASRDAVLSGVVPLAAGVVALLILIRIVKR